MRDCGLTDRGVRDLADGLPKLRSLNLEHCSKVRPLAVDRISHCQSSVSTYLQVVKRPFCCESCELLQK